MDCRPSGERGKRPTSMGGFPHPVHGRRVLCGWVFPKSVQACASPALTGTGISARSNTPPTPVRAAPRLKRTLRQSPPSVRESKGHQPERTRGSRSLNRVLRLAVPRCAGDDVDAGDDRGRANTQSPQRLSTRGCAMAEASRSAAPSHQRTRPSPARGLPGRRADTRGMPARLSGGRPAGTRRQRGPSVAVRGKPSGYTDRPVGTKPVRYASVDGATQRSTAIQGDTRRDNAKRPA